MQSEILEKYPTANLKVYAIWLPVLGGDRRSTWDPEVMTDPRVSHFYDAERVAGVWFAQNVTFQDGYVWDAHLLYGPDAQWDKLPSKLLSSGGTIIDKGPALRDKLVPLLAP